MIKYRYAAMMYKKRKINYNTFFTKKVQNTTINDTTLTRIIQIIKPSQNNNTKKNCTSNNYIWHTIINSS